MAGAAYEISYAPMMTPLVHGILHDTSNSKAAATSLPVAIRARSALSLSNPLHADMSARLNMLQNILCMYLMKYTNWVLPLGCSLPLD